MSTWASSFGLFCSTASRHWNMAVTWGSLSRNASSGRQMWVEIVKMKDNMWDIRRNWVILKSNWDFFITVKPKSETHRCNICACAPDAGAKAGAELTACEPVSCGAASARLCNFPQQPSCHRCVPAPGDWTEKSKRDERGSPEVWTTGNGWLSMSVSV